MYNPNEPIDLGVAPDPIDENRRTIRRIFVHCTATSQKARVESIRRYWREHNHWTFPGYHYIVLPSGTIERLCEDRTVANGVRGYNATSIHVAYLGGITDPDSNGKPHAIDNRTDAQRAALRSLLQRLRRLYPTAQILGHRDISPDKNHNGRVDPWERIKECPCFDAREEYKDI